MGTSRGRWAAATWAVVALAFAATGCGVDGDRAGAPTPSTTAAAPSTTATPTTRALTTSTSAPDGDGAFARPAWLGTRALPVRPDGFGEVQPTPPELVDRRLATPDRLPPPPDDTFTATVAPVPPDVLARSTWQEACPVAAAELRHVTASHWGFDGEAHTGELLVHAEVADDVVAVLRRLHEVRFPLEEVRITTAAELVAPPTGDGNVTGAFVCRPSVAPGGAWSEHAFGRAMDVNPFHNPYVRGDVVLPELASAYLDRSALRPGMIVAGDEATAAFAAVGWGWGGAWRSAQDPMHFSVSGT